MAEGTSDFYLRPQDGWVAVVTGPEQHVLIRSGRAHIAVAVGATAPSLNDTPASANISYTGQPSDTNTVTINGVVYTFNTVLGAAGSVLIGATPDDSYANLAAAINGTAGEGTTYGTGTEQPASVRAVHVPGSDDLGIFGGPGDNGIAVAETLDNAAFDGSATSLSGGAPAVKGFQFGGTTADFEDTLRLDDVQGNVYVRALHVGARRMDVEPVRVSVIVTGAVTP